MCETFSGNICGLGTCELNISTQEEFCSCFGSWESSPELTFQFGSGLNKTAFACIRNSGALFSIWSLTFLITISGLTLHLSSMRRPSQLKRALPYILFVSSGATISVLRVVDALSQNTRFPLGVDLWVNLLTALSFFTLSMSHAIFNYKFLSSQYKTLHVKGNVFVLKLRAVQYISYLLWVVSAILSVCLACINLVNKDKKELFFRAVNLLSGVSIISHGATFLLGDYKTIIEFSNVESERVRITKIARNIKKTRNCTMLSCILNGALLASIFFSEVALRVFQYTYAIFFISSVSATMINLYYFKKNLKLRHPPSHINNGSSGAKKLYSKSNRHLTTWQADKGNLTSERIHT
eukprot:snap_masked-scaffold_7-processed-gene-10.47-mRNA-1 protein AED:0.08 eAED:1.00 QI:0/0/0/1/1/1/2/0/351